MVEAPSPHKHHSIPERWIGPLFHGFPLDPAALQDPEPTNIHLKKRANCGKTFVLLTCRLCGNMWKVPQRCDERICFDCASKRRARLIAKYGPIVRRMKWPAFISLTTPNVPGDQLRLTMMSLVKRFHAMRRRAGWRSRVNGWGMWTLEVTYNEHTNRYHPHLHAIIETAWMPKEVVSALWVAGWTTIKRVTSTPDGIRELVKYVTKNPKDTPAEALGAIATAFERLRAVQPFGRIPKDCSKLDQEGTTVQEHLCSCGGSLSRGWLSYSEEEVDQIPEYPPGGVPVRKPDKREGTIGAIEKPREQPDPQVTITFDCPES